MKAGSRVLIAFAMCLWGGALHAADEEMVENPIYASWAKHKVGTTVSGKMDGSLGGRPVSAEITSKLVEVTPAKVVVEETRTMKGPNGPLPAQTTKEEHLARIAKSKAEHVLFQDSTKVKVTKVTSEKLDIAGKTYECTVKEFSSEEEGAKMSGKTWESADVPGMAVKMDSSGTSPGGPMTVNVIVTKIETK